MRRGTPGKADLQPDGMVVAVFFAVVVVVLKAKVDVAGGVEVDANRG